MPAALKDSDHMNPRLKGITGIILAGGKSSRYGMNKALVEINGVRLIERVISVMESIFEHLIIITNTPHDYAYLQLPMYEDLIKGLGPLGGILTGLEAISDDAGFIVACDMPFLKADLVRYMVDIRADYYAVVPKITWKIEALHALYNKRCLPAIRELIESQEYQAIKFFDRIRVRYVEEDEIRASDPHLRSFFNVNSPRELLDAEQLVVGSD
jgi:molybdopterin-guanine dinucleotide biosynthesis protein A